MDTTNIASQFFETVAQSILQLIPKLGQQFSTAVEALYQLEGKIIICGMGKSGLVGKKIAATLSSTGSMACFLHPAEALHGDLGIVGPKDCFVSISNSGETDEILRVVPAIQQLGILHITLVGNPISSLAKHADIVLDIGVETEGARLSVVPMASGLTTMAMGDALAAALLIKKDFKAADFAQLHMGGSLGRKLLHTVGNQMQQHQLPHCVAEASIKEVIVQISSSSFGLVAILNHQGEIVGIITDGDLRRALNESLDASFFELRAKDVMTGSPKTIGANQSLLEAEELMQEHRITALLVAAEQKLIGIIGKHQIK